MRSIWLIAFVLCGATGCLGTIGNTSDGDASPPHGDGFDPTRAVTRFTCDPALLPVPSGTRRLTKEQLATTLADLVRAILPNEASAIVSELQSPLAALPPETVSNESDYASMSQLVAQAHVDAYYALALRFGTALASRRGALLGTCATNATTSDDAQCVRAAIVRVGRLAFRRPLLDTETSFFVQTYDASGINADALADVFASMLLAPSFVYRIELGTDDLGNGTYRLSAYELATRLSYHFWGSMPDDALLSAAADGSLLTDDGYRGQVERLFADERARRAAERFYAQWLRLDNLPDMTANVGRPDFAAYTGDDLPTADLREHLIADAQDLVSYYTFDDPNGSFDDLFATRASFARTSDVARLYGEVDIWDGSGEPPTHVQAGRVGLLSRAAMLVNNQAVTRPIMRGVFVMRRMMCQNVQLPPMMQGIVLQTNEGLRTTRQMIADLSQAPGSTCAGCHAIINPLGFVAEGFDALGRLRSQESVYSTDDGSLLATLPVDTSVDAIIAGEGAALTDVAGMQQELLASGAVQACFARHYVRHTFGREEDLEADGCMLENLRTRVVEGGSLAAVLQSIAMADAFKTVRKE